MEKVLVLGGTNFIGKNLIEELIKGKNWDITFFNRGLTNSELFPDLKRIQGDRNSNDIQKIFKYQWDYIIDLSCYYPSNLSEIVNGLQYTPKKYIFISTCSVYDNDKLAIVLRDETAPILNCLEGQKRDDSIQTYGNRKAECERVLNESELNYTILRPALVYGPNDPTDRFYYWMYQVNNSPSLLLPEAGLRKFSVTYVQDIVNSVLNLLNPETSRETFNMVSSPETSISEIVGACQDSLQIKNTVMNVNAEFLNESKINQWTDMPLWLNSDFYTYSNSKIKTHLDIKMTTLDDGIRETVPYFDKLEWPIPNCGISESKRLDLMEHLVKSFF